MVSYYKIVTNIKQVPQLRKEREKRKKKERPFFLMRNYPFFSSLSKSDPKKEII